MSRWLAALTSLLRRAQVHVIEFDEYVNQIQCRAIFRHKHEMYVRAKALVFVTNQRRRQLGAEPVAVRTRPLLQRVQHW